MNFSQFLQEAAANWINGSAFPAVPTGLEFALSTADPTDDGSGLVEPPAIDGYARQAFTLNASISTLGNGTSAFNTADAVFGPAVNADWPTVTHGAIFDSGTGDLLFHGPLNAQRVAVVGDTITFGAGIAIQPQVIPLFSHFVGSFILEWMRGTAAPAAPTSLELAIAQADPLEDGSGIAEPVGNYARQAVTFTAPITTIGVGTAMANPAAVLFGPANAAWGTITHGAVFDQGGNQLMQGAVAASRTIISGDAYVVSPGALALLIR